MARLAIAALAAWLALAGPAAARELVVVPGGSIQQAIAEARPGDRVHVRAGTYREHVVVTTPDVMLVGEGRPTLDGGGKGSVVMLRAPHAGVMGFRLVGTGESLNGDDAGVKVDGTRDCVVEDNDLAGVFYGVDLQKSPHNLVRHNRIVGGAPVGTFEGWGDGIRAWNSPDNRLVDNEVTGFRDGLYLEFAARTTIEGNDSHDNRRYGLHFMFMDDSRFAGNRFRRNQAGTVLMYSKRIRVEGNTFGENRGSVGDGVLFKENNDSVIAGNRVLDNTVGLFLDSSNRNRIEGNLVAGNGWGLLLYASSTANTFTRNAFIGNAYEIAVDMPHSANTIDGNYWSGYQGYDLDGDGRGDTSYCPVSLFAFLSMQYPDLVAFAQSPAVQALAFAQKLLPALAPSTLKDAHPLLAPGRMKG